MKSPDLIPATAAGPPAVADRTWRHLPLARTIVALTVMTTPAVAGFLPFGMAVGGRGEGVLVGAGALVAGLVGAIVAAMAAVAAIVAGAAASVATAVGAAAA